MYLKALITHQNLDCILGNIHEYYLIISGDFDQLKSILCFSGLF